MQGEAGELTLGFEYFPRGEERALRLVVCHPQVGLAFKHHCFEVGPFRGGTGEKRPDGSVAFTYEAGPMTCVTTFTARPGGRVEMHLVATGPLEELKKIRFIDGCMQHWESPAFRRRGALSEFAGRCFLYTMRGPVGLLDTPRGKQKGFAADSPWNNPPGTQWYVPPDSQHPGDAWAFGTCGDRPVARLIGARSRDGEWLTAIGIRYSLNIGQGWHDCLHCGGHTRWYLDEKESIIRQKTMLYVMPNDEEKLLEAYRADFDIGASVGDLAKAEPSDNQGLRDPRPGSRALLTSAMLTSAHPPWPSFQIDALGGKGTGRSTETYWGTRIREGADWRIWEHPGADGFELCVSVSSAAAKPGEAVARASVVDTAWTEAAVPDGLPAKVLRSKDGARTAALFWERPAAGNPAKGVGELQEPGARTVSVRGRLVVCHGGPEELIRQWEWAQEDWENARPYRMPAPGAEAELVGSSVTFAPHRETAVKERLTYGLTILPPWKDGGSLHVNFPEHLEYDAEEPTKDYVGYSLLRHSDEIDSPWRISADGRTASFRVESPHERGVIIEARLTAQASEAVLWMKITNGSGKRLPRVKPLLCFQYRKLAGFPQGLDGNFRYTYVVVGGRLVRLADLATARPDPQAMVAYVKGCGQHDCDKFANSRGGLIAQEIDAAAAAVTSKDGHRKVILAFAPPKSVLSNAFIPCLHADPYLGDLEPGGSAEASGVIMFTEGDLEPAVKEAVGLEWLRGAGR